LRISLLCLADLEKNLGTDIKAIDLDEKMVALLDEAADILSVTRD
jgi:hypothetical protein